MLKVALPNKGSLSEDAVKMVSEAGYKCKRHGPELTTADETNNIEFFFLRPRDIPVYVNGGEIDIGISGRDLTIDSGVEFQELLALGFGKSRFMYAVPAESNLEPSKLEGCRIATSYPGLVEKDLQERGLSAKILRLDGAVEIAVKLGVADAIADVVETGRTLREAGLKVVGDPIFFSEAIILGRAGKEQDATAAKFVQRVQGIVVARQYIVVEYDIPNKTLRKACSVTPGIESPTVSPLSEEGWSAVKAMVEKKDLNAIMDRLSALGAKGVMFTEIKTCRI
ncbi:MAG: ATP phosphoribosyltransferase [Verrucomicrobiota bacterium]